MLKKIRSKLVHSKLFINRTMSWISMINAGMLLFLVLSRLEVYGINIDIGKWFFPIFILTILLMLIFGYMEDKLGFYKEESRAATRRNPYMNEIINKLDKIDKRLNKIEKKK